MARRDWPLLFTCGHAGCNERATYRYSTRRDMMESFEQKHFSNGRWRCIRHSNPEQVLSAVNTTTRHEITLEERPHGKFFGNFGFVSGPGFKIFANDFPPGTKLIVLTQVVLPNDQEPQS